MTTLFPEAPESALPIPGLKYLPDYITTEEERRMLERVDSGVWDYEYSRRRQQFGYRYDYKSEYLTYIGPLPDWLQSLAERLARDGIFERMPDQALVNEYLPGQGIAPHVDRFSESVVSLSLGSGILMDFTRVSDSEKRSLWLEPRSLLILQGEARHHWQHSIAKRLKDQRCGELTPRSRRVSLTFRSVGHSSDTHAG
jgi:alkylated DNA repair dioxygenase AlkB